MLQTGLENLNLIVHPAMVLPNIGAMERAKLEGKKFGFYQEGVVPAAGVLGDALDAERKLVCEAYGVEHTPMAKAIEQYDGFRSNTFYEAMQNPVYKSFPAFQPDIWREWAAVDLPYAIVPCVQLADQAGIAVPLHRAFAEILGVLLGVTVEVRAVACGHGPRGLAGGGEEAGAWFQVSAARFAFPRYSFPRTIP